VNLQFAVLAFTSLLAIVDPLGAVISPCRSRHRHTAARPLTEVKT
jgi:hypothetical protein